MVLGAPPPAPGGRLVLLTCERTSTAFLRSAAARACGSGKEVEEGECKHLAMRDASATVSCDERG